MTDQNLRGPRTPGALEPPIPPKHDAGYKGMFNDAKAVEHLLRDLRANLARTLDIKTLARLPADFVTRDLRRCAGDQLWRVDFLDRDKAPLFVLLEFQSTPDARMSVRVLEYKALAIREAIDRRDTGAGRGRPPFLRRHLQRDGAVERRGCAAGPVARGGFLNSFPLVRRSLTTEHGPKADISNCRTTN